MSLINLGGQFGGHFQPASHSISSSHTITPFYNPHISQLGHHEHHRPDQSWRPVQPRGVGWSFATTHTIFQSKQIYKCTKGHLPDQFWRPVQPHGVGWSAWRWTGLSPQSSAGSTLPLVPTCKYFWFVTVTVFVIFFVIVFVFVTVFVFVFNCTYFLILSWWPSSSNCLSLFVVVIVFVTVFVTVFVNVFVLVFVFLWYLLLDSLLVAVLLQLFVPQIGFKCHYLLVLLLQDFNQLTWNFIVLVPDFFFWRLLFLCFPISCTLIVRHRLLLSSKSPSASCGCIADSVSFSFWRASS